MCWRARACFECILSHENTGDVAEWTVSWKTGQLWPFLCHTRQGRKYTLAIRDAVPSDAGEVVFSVRGLTSKASLIVKGGGMVAAGTDWLGQVQGCFRSSEPGLSPGSLEPGSWAWKLQGLVSRDCLPASAEHLEASVGVSGGSGHQELRTTRITL